MSRSVHVTNSQMISLGTCCLRAISGRFSDLGGWQGSYILWIFYPWWRHQMETFSALLAICAGNSPVPGEFLAQRSVTRRFDVFCDLRQNKRLSKQSWGWWFETLSRPLRRHRNAYNSCDVALCSSDGCCLGCYILISSHKGQWRGALMFSVICVRINGWVNNREAGDLKRYRAHNDVSVMRITAVT